MGTNNSDNERRKLSQWEKRLAISWATNTFDYKPARVHKPCTNILLQMLIWDQNGPLTQ